MSESILDGTKKALGLDPAYDVFDAEIVMHINSVFATLNQLGIGPVDGYEIEDASALWDHFLAGKPKFNSLKTYMYLRVRLLFDPPATSFAITAIKEQITELEWRLNVQRETTSTLLLGGFKKITGNLGDEHTMRLANPIGQTLINSTGSYEAEFASRDGRIKQTITLDTSQKASGILFLPVVIKNGTYTVRNTNPRRTILVLEVSTQ